MRFLRAVWADWRNSWEKATGEAKLLLVCFLVLLVAWTVFSSLMMAFA